MKPLFKIIYIKLLTIVGIASIYDGNHWYRVTGFYYRYQYADGRYRDPKPCHRFFANAIGGYGSCGWYPLIDQLKLSGWTFESLAYFSLSSTSIICGGRCGILITIAL